MAMSPQPTRNVSHKRKSSALANTDSTLDFVNHRISIPVTQMQTSHLTGEWERLWSNALFINSGDWPSFVIPYLRPLEMPLNIHTNACCHLVEVGSEAGDLHETLPNTMKHHSQHEAMLDSLLPPSPP